MARIAKALDIKVDDLFDESGRAGNEWKQTLAPIIADEPGQSDE
jgi:hypothetical protein